MGRAVKNSLEIIIEQVRPEGGFKRGGRIRVAECLRQTVPARWMIAYIALFSALLSRLTVLACGST